MIIRPYDVFFDPIKNQERRFAFFLHEQQTGQICEDDCLAVLGQSGEPDAGIVREDVGRPDEPVFPAPVRETGETSLVLPDMVPRGVGVDAKLVQLLERLRRNAAAVRQVFDVGDDEVRSEFFTEFGQSKRQSFSSDCPDHVPEKQDFGLFHAAIMPGWRDLAN